MSNILLVEMSSVLIKTNQTKKVEMHHTLGYHEPFSLVCTYFDETDGPQVLYQEPWLDEDLLNSISIKVFSYVMAGVEFHTSSKFKVTSIVQIPKSEYYALTIEFIVRKNPVETNGSIIVPLLFFVIFKPDLFTKVAEFIPELERKLNTYFQKELMGSPSPKQIDVITTKLKLFLHAIFNTK